MLLLFRLYSMAIALTGWLVELLAVLLGLLLLASVYLPNRIGAVQTAAPFLFPCTIEYSLICAVILFEMWKHISSDKKHHVQELKSHKDSHQLSINCAGSNRGMFGGILVSINACFYIKLIHSFMFTFLCFYLIIFIYYSMMCYNIGLPYNYRYLSSLSSH